MEGKPIKPNNLLITSSLFQQLLTSNDSHTRSILQRTNKTQVTNWLTWLCEKSDFLPAFLKKTNHQSHSFFLFFLLVREHIPIKSERYFHSVTYDDDRNTTKG